MFGEMPGPRIHAAETPPGLPPTPGWVDRPMRWAQLTLVEDDPGRFDPGFWPPRSVRAPTVLANP